MRLFKVFVCLIIASFLVCPGLAPEAMAGRKPVKIEGKKVLPLRVLARPYSNVYKDKDAASGVVRENVPTFQPFYVYTRPTAEDKELQQAWYEVGTDNRGGVIGWMKADDVFEWKQTMCLAYTHPEGRKPVLMFDGRDYIKKLLAEPAEKRIQDAEGLYTSVENGKFPQDFPVKSVEPKQAVDISEQFYLLPILNFEVIELDGREGRLVRLAAATAGGPKARESSDIRTNKDYLTDASTGSTTVSADTLKKLAIDLVWVMDTTVSMKRPIAKTLEVVKSVSQQIGADPDLSGSVKFGIWGYRDSANDIPGIEYTTKNYTPELQAIDQFIPTLAQVKVTEVDSVDYPEDVFSGVDEAIRLTKWSPDALRIVILCADAPAHEPGHKWNLSGQSATTLRKLADDYRVYFFALHLKDPRAKKFHPLAEEQFTTLSKNKGGQGEAAYLSLVSNDEAAFGRTTADLAGGLLSMLSQAKKGSGVVDVVAPVDSGDKPTGGDQPAAGKPKGELADLEPEKPAAAPGQQPAPQPIKDDKPASSPAPGDAKKVAEAVFKAALVEWIGSKAGAQAPRDIVAWATDKDLIEPAIQSMEVRLLINKRQLDSLKTIMSEVMAAGRRGQIGGDDFFDALQAASATAARDADLIKNAKTMAATGLVPEFLIGLPYKSRLMAMNNELWASWSVDEQDEFLSELEAKIKAYQAIHDSPEGWIGLNKGDDPDEHVYPISLELLP